MFISLRNIEKGNYFIECVFLGSGVTTSQAFDANLFALLCCTAIADE